MDPKDVQIAMLQRNLRVLASAMQTQSRDTLGPVGSAVSSPSPIGELGAFVTTERSTEESLKQSSNPVRVSSNNNSEVAPLRSVSSDSRKPRAAVVAWDLSHNPVGRAYVLYKLLEKNWDVELIGPIWSRYGTDVWPPLKNAGLNLRTFTCDILSDFIPKAQLLVESADYDLVVVCKPRLPSIYIGALIREKCQCKVILDIDDHELSFFEDHRSATLVDLQSALEENPLLDEFELYQETGTRVAQGLIDTFDGITVSNLALQEKFGGQIVRHARDEGTFLANAANREKARESLGIESHQFAILFIGTPREHKGIFKVAEALQSLDDERIVFHIVGTISDSRIKERLASYQKANIVLHPNCNFADLPFLLSAADLVPLLQDPDHPISQYQIPAKISDASALGIPIVATRTPPVVDLIASGIVQEVTEDNLEQTIAEYLSSNGKKNLHLRNRFLAELSQSVNRSRLELLIQQIEMESHLSPVESPDGLNELVDIVDAAYKSYREKKVDKSTNILSTSAVKPGVKNSLVKKLFSSKTLYRDTAVIKNADVDSDDKLNFAFFWKQNDSGMYGRRSDMMVKYLSQSAQVGKIIQFDAPVDWVKIAPLIAETSTSDTDNDLIRLHDRCLKIADTDSIRYRTYIDTKLPSDQAPIEDNASKHSRYAEYIRQELSDFGLTVENTIAWFCPVIWDAPELIDTLNFRGVVSDLIDDQRAWKNTESQIAQLDANYAETLARSNLVISNCQELADAFSTYQSVHVVPNGAERLSEQAPTDKPAALAQLPGTIFGYVGTLRDRIDWMLLDEVVPQFPDASFVFIGPGHDIPQAKQLAEHSNVHMLGPIAYDKILPFLRGFDVGVIPHIRNRLTQRMNPLKLYNYFASGLPVVTTDISNLTDVVDQIHIAHSAEEFVKALQVSSHEKVDVKSDKWRAAMNSIAWDNRVSDIVQQLEQCFEARVTDITEKVDVA